MKHTLPESHLELLQGIYMELVKQRDGDAEFVTPDDPVEPEAKPAAIGEATE